MGGICPFDLMTVALAAVVFTTVALAAVAFTTVAFTAIALATQKAPPH